MEELNIVHEEDVERAVELFHLVDRFAPQRIDDIVDEGLCGDDLHSLFFVVLLNIVANAVEEVRLSQSYTAMDEERIVRFTRPRGHSECSRLDKLIGRAFDEVFKDVERIEFQIGRGTLLRFREGGWRGEIPFLGLCNDKANGRISRLPQGEKIGQYFFEVVEEIEEKADEILERDRSAYLKRLCQYAHGLLYFFGAALCDTVEREIKSVSECKKPFSREELMYYLKEEPGIIMDGDLLYLEGIENPRLILEELSMRGLKQHSPYSLSALKLAQEGRVAEMFFTQDEDNEDIDEDLRRLTHDKLNLVLSYEELRKDVTGRQHHDLLLNRVLNKNRVHAQEIVDIFTYIWNNLPRWEIGGRIAADLGAKRNREGIAPQLEKYVTAFSPPKEIYPPKRKIGRNEPCPCGSGKKYKKCCGV